MFEGFIFLLTLLFNHFNKTEQLIIGVYDIIQYFILELSDFCFYCDNSLD